MEQSSHQYAGFWIRVLAGLIDMAILAAIGYALGGGEATQVVEAGKFRMGFFGVNFTGWRLLIPVLYTLIFLDLDFSNTRKIHMRYKNYRN